MGGKLKGHRITHKRINKNQRMDIREYVFAYETSSLEESRQKAKELRDKNTGTKIEVEGGKYLIYTYAKAKPVKVRRLDTLYEQGRTLKTEGMPNELQAKPKRRKATPIRVVKRKSLEKTLEQFKEQDDKNKEIRRLVQLWKAEAQASDVERGILGVKKDDKDGYYSPKLVRLLLKYYYSLAEGYVPFDNNQSVAGGIVGNAMIGSKTRYIDPTPYFERAIIWKSDIDGAISKLKSNGDISLPWSKVCRETNDETVKPFLPFLDIEQRIIVEHFILEDQQHLEAGFVLKKLVKIINGEYEDANY